MMYGHTMTSAPAPKTPIQKPLGLRANPKSPDGRRRQAINANRTRPESAIHTPNDR